MTSKTKQYETMKVNWDEVDTFWAEQYQEDYGQYFYISQFDPGKYKKVIENKANFIIDSGLSSLFCLIQNSKDILKSNFKKINSKDLTQLNTD